VFARGRLLLIRRCFAIVVVFLFALRSFLLVFSAIAVFFRRFWCSVVCFAIVVFFFALLSFVLVVSVAIAICLKSCWFGF
jgi:hypothetical protein